MDLRTLQYFVTVAEELNITKAAEKLHMSQPPLSAQMKRLERELNTELFIRGKRHLDLTESGELLYRRAKEILRMAEKTRSEILSLSDGMRGTISIGLVEGIAPDIASEWFAGFLKMYPNIKFRILDGSTDDLLEKLRSGIISLAVITSPCDNSLLHSFSVGKEKLAALISKDHPLAKKGFVTVHDLENIPLLASRQTMMMREFSGLLGRDLNSLNVIATYNLLYNASVFVEQGLGAALCLEGLLNTGGKSKLAFVPFTPLRTSGLVVVWKKNPVFSKPAAAFLQSLKQELGME